MHRRQFLGLGAALGTSLLAGCTLGTFEESDRRSGATVSLEPVLSGLTFPTDMAFLRGGGSLVAERDGQVLRATEDDRVEGPILDLSDRLAGTQGEQGLLGLACHPSFADNRKFYVRYSGRAAEEALSHTEVLAAFEAEGDLRGVVPGSERRILEVPQPGPNHNAGGIAFGPDGYLYVAFGDGQRQPEDRGWSWWHDQGETAQNTMDNLLGGILRIDVDTADGDRPYGIPPDNPLVDRPGRDEYYAWGLRNPYRISFDGTDLFVADVGEHVREAVYRTEKGANHGWPILEGSSCAPSTAVGHTVQARPLQALNPKTWQALTNRISPIGVCPTPPGADTSYQEPLIAYHRPGARAITGGFVYRGDAISALHGLYIFGDFIAPSPLFAVDPAVDGPRPRTMAELEVLGTADGRLEDALVSFGRDGNGEIYVLTTSFAEGGGRIRRLAPPRANAQG